MKKLKLLRTGITSLIIAVFFLAAGSQVFQGNEKTDFQKFTENFYDYDESDPYIDRPTNEARMHLTEGDDILDIITDVNGYDNFEIGVDFAEQMLVSNPRNPLNMQFGVNSGGGQNAYYTTNGHDWTQSNPSYHPSTCCDPWSAFDSLGNLFYGSGVSNQYVYKSTNGGQTYGSAVLSVSGNDRNTLAADQTNGPYKNYLYAAITPGNFSRSTNGGTSWTTTYTPSNTIPGVMIAVGPNGSTQGGCVMYVTNTGTSSNVTYTFHRSLNGGATFSLRSSLTVAGYVGTLNTAGRLVINNGRTRPYPMIAMDNSYGPYRGRLYLVYASNVPAGNGNKPDIILQYSDDQGLTWSSKRTVNNVTTGDQWFPAIWCEKETGRLYIKWYDTRENPATYAVNVYATYTDNGGASFASNQKLTNQSWTYPSPSCAPNINCYRGDYDGMTANTKTSFSVWYDGRLGTYKNVAAYFPDFALLTSPTSQPINRTNDSKNFAINIPSVKLYSDVTTFSAQVTTLPVTGGLQVEFLDGNTLNSYPGTKYMKVKTIGTVTPNGNYNIVVTAKGSNGTPVHKRTVTVNVGTTVGSVPCEDFSAVKFPPADFFADYSGTNYWIRSNNSAYGLGIGSARFSFYNASLGTEQSLVTNNFNPVATRTYLTFDEAYAPYGAFSFGPDTLVLEVSSNSGSSYSVLKTLIGNFEGTGELNSAPPTFSSYVPLNSDWRSKIYLLPPGTNKIRLKAKSGFGNNLYIDNLCVQVIPNPPVDNSIGLVNQGMFIPTNPFWTILDTVRVYLHRTDFPNIAVDSAISIPPSNAVFDQLMFNNALDGNYYKVVKHRNSIETWSSGAIPYIRGSNTNYNFVQPDGQAYGNNQAIVSLSPLYRGIYSGDCNQDGVVDITDLAIIDNAAFNFESGYVVADLNGDYFADLSDYALADNNAFNIITKVTPPGAQPPPAEDSDKNPVFKTQYEKEKYELHLRTNHNAKNINQNKKPELNEVLKNRQEEMKNTSAPKKKVEVNSQIDNNLYRNSDGTIIGQ